MNSVCSSGPAANIRGAKHQMKPELIVKPYIPEKEYKLSQVYVPRVVEDRPLEEEDENMYAGELEYYDDLPDIDEEQMSIMHEYKFGTPQRRRNRYFCQGCFSCSNDLHQHCCIDSVCVYVQELNEQCEGCCVCLL
nr:uncharacterized protein LOC124818659 [Hydra vulgaris]